MEKYRNSLVAEEESIFESDFFPSFN